MVGFFRDPSSEDISQSSWCKRCGKKVMATRHHTTYECADNRNIRVPIFLMTERILTRATKENLTAHACLWYRGMIPRNLLHKRRRATVSEAKLWVTPGFDTTLAKRTLGY